MHFYLRGCTITHLIRGKGFTLAKYLITSRGWLVEWIHHEVKIARQGGHDSDLLLLCSWEYDSEISDNTFAKVTKLTYNLSHQWSKLVRVFDPWAILRVLEMTHHATICNLTYTMHPDKWSPPRSPSVKFFLNERLRSLRHEAERITTKVGAFGV